MTENCRVKIADKQQVNKYEGQIWSSACSFFSLSHFPTLQIIAQKKLSHIYIDILISFNFILAHGVAKMMMMCVTDEFQTCVIVFRYPNLVTLGVQCHVD